MDFVEPCVDEIALEGLEGITLSALWQRLERRLPKFPLSIDAQSKSFIWANVAKHPELEFYELPVPRPPLVIYDRYDYYDEESGSYYEPTEAPDDIYPVNIINEDGVRGSCSTYQARKKVTNLIRDYHGNLLWMLQEVEERWGEYLVVVASQEQRNLALMGPDVDPFLKLKDIQYCILERVGRSRWNGELVTGIVSLNVFKQSSKTHYYFRKTLIQHNLIRKQVHVHAIKKPNRGQFQMSHVKLLHLTRFFTTKKGRYMESLEKVCNYLNGKDDKMESCATIIHDCDVDVMMMKRLSTHAMNFLKVVYIPISQVYPDVPDDKKYTKGQNERVVKMLRLNKMIKEEDEDDEDEESAVNEDEQIEKMVWRRDLPLMNQAYDFVCKQGPNGINGRQLAYGMGLTRLDARNIMRNLDRMGVAFCMMVERGRQRVTRMVAEIHRHKSDAEQKFNREKGRILALTATPSDKAKMPAPSPSSSRKKSVRTPDVKCVKTEQLDEHCIVMHDITIEDESKPLEIATEEEAFASIRKDTANLTLRWLKRANIIIETVRREQVIDNLTLLRNKMIELEKAEGLEGIFDRKSLERIVNRLAKEGQIKSIKTVIKHNGIERKLQFLCDKDVPVSDRRIQSVIERSKMNIMGLSFTKQSSSSNKKPRVPRATSANTAHIKQEIDTSGEFGTGSSSLRKLVTLQNTNINLEYDHTCGRKYGLLPKMRRLEVFHKLLFYLVRDNRSRKPAPIADSIPAEICPLDVEGEPEVMVDEMNWKRYLSHLPKHHGYDEGWFYLSDVILQIPLVLFCQLISINYKIEELPELLNDPVRKLYPLQYLAPPLVQKILFKRKYIFALNNLCTNLCYLGLLSMGPQHEKEKDRLFAYIHTQATLRDTSISDPGYRYVSTEIEYEPKYYVFTNYQVVEQYWLDLEVIGMNTKLGLRNERVEGEDFNYKQDMFAKPDLLKMLRPKSNDAIDDNGFLPGDGLGAAGIDSCFYAHRRVNWTWSKLDKPQSATSDTNKRLAGLKNTVEIIIKDSDGNPVRVEQVTLSSVTNIHGQKGGKGQKRKAVNAPAHEKPPKIKKSIVPPKPKKPPSKSKRVHDDIDESALREMRRTRCNWTPEEDTVLLLCHVTNSFLYQKKGMMITSQLVRDILHYMVPTATDKTVLACRRRLLFMLKNPVTYNNVCVYLGEALACQELVEKYKTGKEYFFSQADKNADVFMAVFKCLYDRFVIKGETTGYHLPLTREELKEKFSLHSYREHCQQKSVHTDPKTTDDILYSSVHNLIHSTLSLNDKIGRAHELYKIYSQYPDKLLESVVKVMEADKIITRIKPRLQAQAKTFSRCTQAFQLTQRYRYAFLYLTKFPRDLFDDAYTTIQLLHGNLKDHQGEQMNITHKDVGGITAALVSLQTNRKLLFETTIPEQIILVDQVKKSDEDEKSIDKQIEDDESEEEKEEDEMMKASAQQQKDLDGTSTEEYTASNITEELSVIHPMPEGVSSTSADKMQPDINLDDYCSYQASRVLLSLAKFKLGIKMRNLSPYDKIVVNPCNIKVSLKNSPKAEEFAADLDLTHLFSFPVKEQSLLPSKELGHLVLAPIRQVIPMQLDEDEVWNEYADEFELNEDQAELVKEIYAYILAAKWLGCKKSDLRMKWGATCVNYIEILATYGMIWRVGVTEPRYVAFSYLRPWIVHGYKNLKGRAKLIDKSIKDYDSCVSTYLRDPSAETNTSTESNNDCDDVVVLQDAEGKDDTDTDKAENIPDQQEKPSKDAEAEVEAVESGDKSMETDDADKPDESEDKEEKTDAEETTSTSRPKRQGKAPEKFSDKPEAVSTSQSGYDRVRFIARPWMKPEGLINKPTLKMMLEGLMMYIMSNPGIKFGDLCEKLNPILQPMCIIELVEVLEKIGCINRINIVKPTHGTSLFSKRLPVTASDIEDDVNCAFSPSSDCAQRIGAFITAHLETGEESIIASVIPLARRKVETEKPSTTSLNQLSDLISGASGNRNKPDADAEVIEIEAVEQQEALPVEGQYIIQEDTEPNSIPIVVEEHAADPEVIMVQNELDQHQQLEIAGYDGGAQTVYVTNADELQQYIRAEADGQTVYLQIVPAQDEDGNVVIDPETGQEVLYSVPMDAANPMVVSGEQGMHYVVDSDETGIQQQQYVLVNEDAEGNIISTSEPMDIN
ncbi:general transcription factor 3C polypeptide 1-like [Tubulanus polymorphus]|uniref:general transcription factor 3C polypeptide 1-like n=1 Tax=Tubulanus polymorphus TaxID=672921 RepID=UPI003DA24357